MQVEEVNINIKRGRRGKGLEDKEFFDNSFTSCCVEVFLPGISTA